MNFNAHFVSTFTSPNPLLACHFSSFTPEGESQHSSIHLTRSSLAELLKQKDEIGVKSDAASRSGNAKDGGGGKEKGERDLNEKLKKKLVEVCTSQLQVLVPIWHSYTICNHET